jgi:hypothetical protein
MTQNSEKVCHSAYRKSVGKMLHRQNARRQNEMSPVQPPGFLRIFIWNNIYSIRAIGNSTMLKIYTLPNHTITIGVCFIETQLSTVAYYTYGCGASFGQKWSMPWMSANMVPVLLILWFLWLVYTKHFIFIIDCVENRKHQNRAFLYSWFFIQRHTTHCSWLLPPQFST